MSVLERYKQRSAYKKSEDSSLSSVPDNIYQPSSFFDQSAQTGGATPVPQLSFTDNPVNPSSDAGLQTSGVPEASTAVIPQDKLQSQVAGGQEEVIGQGLASAPTAGGDDAKTLRAPVRIRGTGKKSSGTMLAPKVSGKRTVTHAAMVALTFFVVFVVLGAVLPTSDGHARGVDGLFSSLLNWSQGKGQNTALSASQIATATAVTQDGYDPGGITVPGVPGPPTSGSPNLNRFFYGQCTYWANMRYGQLTGHYVAWLGNANQWPYGAAASGWIVSSTPHYPSIIAFAPGVDGAGAYGHVGVVESISGNSVTYSSWNVYGAPFATTVYLTVTAPAGGVSFLYYPGT